MGCKLSDYALKIGVICLIMAVSIPHGALGGPSLTKSYILTGNMNLREKSTTASKIVQPMKEGEEFEILGQYRRDDFNSWYLIQTKSGLTGWFCGIYQGKIRFVEEEAPAEPMPALHEMEEIPSVAEVEEEAPAEPMPALHEMEEVPSVAEVEEQAPAEPMPALHEMEEVPSVVEEPIGREIIVPDDYDTIEEAMDSASFGDTVFVKPGTYNERVEIMEGVNLVSFVGSDGNDLVDGPGNKKVLKRTLRTIIDGTGLETPGYLVSFPKDTTAAMRLDGFTIINMPKYLSGINLFVVEIRGCSPEVVNNIVAKNRSWGAILSTGLGLGMGPPFETVARPVIRNNVIYDNHGPGIANGPNSGALLSDNEIFDNRFPNATDEDPDAPGIGVREYARPVIENNVCYRNGAGIGGINLVSHDQALIIRGNILHDNRRGGIGLRAIGGVETNVKVLIENNEIYGNLKAGMRLSKIDEAEIIYNTVFDNGKAGLAIFNVEAVTIEDNEISGNLTAGIRLLNVPSVAVRRNHIYNNITAGIDFIGWEK